MTVETTTPLDSDSLVRNWLDQATGPMLYSTGSAVTYFTGVLYNISGSTDDPPEVVACPGCSWKELLVTAADLAEARCYVEGNTAPATSSHDLFSVGGHMTLNESGLVETGNDCFLMPLCSWHNSTHRNGVPFTVTNKRLLRLKGYMQGEAFSTFSARMPIRDSREFGLVYFDDADAIWKNIDISTAQANNLGNKGRGDPEKYILIKKARNEDNECEVCDVQIN